MPEPRAYGRPRPYDRTTHDGKVVDWFTKLAILKAERILGYELTIVQGSYHQGVRASAGTHDGGGVIDLAEWDWPSKVRALRQCGFAAWHRPKCASWNGHIHAVLVTNRLLSNDAADQADDFRAGRNGLASNGPDPHAGLPFKPFRWPYFGPIGVAKWHRDQLRGKARRNFERRVVRRLGLTRKDLS